MKLESDIWTRIKVLSATVMDDGAKSHMSDNCVEATAPEYSFLYDN